MHIPAILKNNMKEYKQKKKVLVILDCNALIHRSFHALPDFRTAKGELVNAVYGFTSIFLKVLREFRPEYIAATFDVAGPTFRNIEYEEYKAKRPRAPDELYAQIPLVKKILEAFHVSIYEKQGFEADDVIGTVAQAIQKKQVHPKIETIIVSGDLDTLQLVDANTKVYTMRKGLKETILYDIDAVKKRFGGLVPEQMADYKGLRGDPSDNIPGVTGIGEKTGIQLLNEFQTLDKLYSALKKDTEKAKKLKPKLKERLIQYKDQALFSRELATIRLDVPIDFKIEELTWRDFDRNEVEKIFKEFGFRSLFARLPEQSPGVDSALQGSLSIPLLPMSKDDIYEKIEQFYRDRIFSDEIYIVEKKLVPVIREMEETGIKIDKEYFGILDKEMSGELLKLEGAIYKSADTTFNVNSPRQLSEVLFNRLGLPMKGLKKTPGGVVSTAAPELEKLVGRHSVIEYLLKYRELQKLFSTYIKPLPELADEDNRIHTSFHQLGAATGRISSSEPNLQNIPVRGVWGLKIRRGFIAKHEFQFVSFDYSQMELRIAAHVSGDKKMKEYFEQGEDIHTMTAAEVFNVPKEQITKEMRFRAKTLNFGIIYGMGATGFAKSSGISRKDAQLFIDSYFNRFHGMKQYIEDTKDFARKNGYVSTLFGRKRFLPEVNSTNPLLRAQAERMAINHPIQGANADIVKMAMIEVYKECQMLNVKCQMLLQIHDELLFEISNDRIGEVYPKIRSIMENTYKFSVPLKVEVSVGPSWGELKRLVS